MVSMVQPDYSGLATAGNNIASNAMAAYNETKESIANQKLAEAQAAAVAAKQEEAQKMQEELYTLSQKKDATAADYTAIITKYPDLADHFKEILADKTTDEVQAMQSRAQAIATMIDAGQTEKANELLDDFITAAEDAGRTDEVKQYQMMKEVLNASPDTIQGSNMLFLSGTMDPNDFSNFYEKMKDTKRKDEMQWLDMKKTLADANLAEAQASEIMYKINNRGYDLSSLTSEQKNLLAWQELKAAGDHEGAEMFARSAGMLNEASITNEDQYVQSMTDAWKANPSNAGKEVPGGLAAQWRLQYKRAQADEQYANELATQQAKVETAEALSYNNENGKLMAQIAREAELRIAKGELSETETMQNAKLSMEKLTGEIAEKYFYLNSMDAILNTEDNTIESVIKATRTSKLGQTFGRIVGSEPQAARDFINATQAAILNEIKQAKNISARGLDSEKELEFYSRILTDPSKNIQTNLALVALLSDTYGDSTTAKQLRSMIETNPELVQLVANLEQEHEAMYSEATDLPEDVVAARKELGLSVPGDTTDLTKVGAEIPTVTTQAQIDALPSGAYFYVVQNGKTIKARKD